MRRAKKSRKSRGSRAGDPLQHVMIKLKDDPALDAWTAQCAGLISGYSQLVHGDEPESHQIDSFLLHIVGDLVWSASKPSPCWSKLDIWSWLAVMVTMPGWDRRWRDSAIVTVLGFYLYLVESGRIARESVATILCQLNALAQDTVQALVAPFPEPGRVPGELPN